MTLSARANTFGGIVNPICLAVLSQIDSELKLCGPPAEPANIVLPEKLCFFSVSPHVFLPGRMRFATALTHGYTSGMKTAISIPDKIFADAERLSRRLKKSRSQVYTEAVTEYIARHDPEAVTEAMNRVCEAVDTYPDPAISAAARRTLEGVEW